MLNQYDKLAKFYDQIMGDNVAITNEIKNIISERKLDPKEIIDLACGTGTTLSVFPNYINKMGIDNSKKMIEEARSKVPNGHFIIQDIREIKINKKFDISLCVFDSMNHILEFSDWIKVFENASNVTKDGGVFIFDINTLETLELKSKNTAFIKKIGNNYISMKVNKGGKLFTWEIIIFQKKLFNYKLHKIFIDETSFEINLIKNTLHNYFSEIEIRKNSDTSLERVFLICKK
jgi:SAM-dependent methyltransferase